MEEQLLLFCGDTLAGLIQKYYYNRAQLELFIKFRILFQVHQSNFTDVHEYMNFCRDIMLAQ